MIREVANLLTRVPFIETVADYLGVSRMTLNRWYKRGAQESRRCADPEYRPDPGEAIYLDYFVTFRATLAAAEIEATQIIDRAAQEDWRASAWILERRWPERWSRHTREIRDMRKRLAEVERLLARLQGEGGCVAN
jgi:hypothetical protein